MEDNDRHYNFPKNKKIKNLLVYANLASLLLFVVRLYSVDPQKDGSIENRSGEEAKEDII
jgi:hypothetical protein